MFSLYRLLLNLDPIDGGSSAPVPVEVPDAMPENVNPERGSFEIPDDPSSPVAGAGAAPTAPQVPTDPNQRANLAQPGQAQPTADQWQSFRDVAASQYGYQFPSDVQDDSAALRHLIQQAGAARQSDFYSQLGRSLAPHAQGVQQYLQTQQQQQAAPPTRQPWEAPEFDPRWVSLVERDPASGIFTSKQGVPHEIAQKVNAYAEWKDGFDKNPSAVISGMVKAEASRIAQETFREQYAVHQRQAQIGSIVEQNASWLYAQDQAGQRIVNQATGQYVPSPLGARYIHHVDQLRRAGVVDPRQQDMLAKNLVQGEAAVHAYQQGQAAAGQAANPQTAQAVGRPPVNPGQALTPQQRQVTPGATEPTGTGLSLAEMLRQGMAAEGVTDADFAFKD